MRCFFYILCALAGLVVSFRPQRMGTCIGTMRDLSVAKSPIRGPSLVLREKDADEDKLGEHSVNTRGGFKCFA